jgi:DNA mismatch endonuclease, patch repair protein
MGLRYRVDRRPIPELRRSADIVFAPARVAVFVDGCFWHACPRHRTWPKANADWWRSKIEANVCRDRDTDRSLSKAGWKVLRVWEHEDPATAAGKIVKVLEGRERHRRHQPSRESSSRLT